MRPALAAALTALLGPRATPPVEDGDTAARLDAELRASRDAAEPDEWALVRRAWPGDAARECVDTLHRVGRNLGPRDVWLVVPGPVPRAVALDAEAVLDNPIGFAALAEPRDAEPSDAEPRDAEPPGAELRLLDRDVTAGLWLTRDASGWQLDVWGEPWLSATTRALRGIG